MCGIFAAINGKSVTNSLLSGLDALSFRGYDSAGIAIINDAGLDRRRAGGKLENLSKVLDKKPLSGAIGIAHTRWATHGAPTEQNAHPHMTERVAVVHNGIIENYPELRGELELKGYRFQSETDSETIPLLITRYMDEGMSQDEAMRKAVSRLEGIFAVVAIFNGRPDEMYAALQGSPLVVGQAEGGYYLSSDANTLKCSNSSCYCYLEDGDIAKINREKLDIYDLSGAKVEREMRPMEKSSETVGKGKYRHYMLKEMHEQPLTFERTISNAIGLSGNKIGGKKVASQVDQAAEILAKSDRLSIIACGSSYYAGMTAKYWIEKVAALPVDVDIASEYRYREAPISKKNAALFISQSGETADTLAALRYAKESGQSCISVVNVTNSSMANESDRILSTKAGPEIGVATTKAFTSQLAIMLSLALATAKSKGLMTDEEHSQKVVQMLRLPGVMDDFLRLGSDMKKIAKSLHKASNMLCLGRGIAYPLAQEGALKLKEISYIHAEAYPAGELKHGPIALVDEEMPVVVVAPPDRLFAKILSNLREVASRGAKILLISNQKGVDQSADFIENGIVMPDVDELLQPVLYTLPLQMLAYHIAVMKGIDVDHPRNLAKSVTVE